MNNLIIPKFDLSEGVSLDLDNLLYYLEEVNLNFVKNEYGVTLASKDINCWNYYLKNFPRVKEVWTEWEKYSKGRFFNEAKGFIRDLKKITKVKIVTASFPEIIPFKDQFIMESLEDYDIEIIHTTDKSIVTKNSILIDDAAHNIDEHVKANSCPGLLFDYNNTYGWSKDYEGHELVERVYSHEEALIKVESYFR